MCVCMCDSVSRFCDAISCSAFASICDTRQGSVLGCVHVCVCVCVTQSPAFATLFHALRFPVPAIQDRDVF